MKEASNGRLILVRHGESEGNRDRRFTTSPEVGLTDLGRSQALKAAGRIANLFRPQLIMTSHYRRACQTADIIAAQTGLVIEVDPELRERSFGVLAGHPYERALEMAATSGTEPGLWKPPGGESLDEVRQRVLPAIERIALRFPADDVTVVSHGEVMMSLWWHLSGDLESSPHPANGTIFVLEHRAGQFIAPRLIADSAAL